MTKRTQIPISEVTSTLPFVAVDTVAFSASASRIRKSLRTWDACFDLSSMMIATDHS